MFKFLTSENQYFKNLALQYLSYLTRQTPEILFSQNPKLLIFSAR